MTAEDKKQIGIRQIYELDETPQANDINFLLAQLDEAHAALRLVWNHRGSAFAECSVVEQIMETVGKALGKE